jgi:ABC-2 type transport system permease protein
MVTLFLLALAGIVAILACAATMQAVVRLRHEELTRGEAVLTTATGRTRWAGSWILVAGLSGVLVLATFTLAAGVALAAVDDVPRWPDVLRVGASMLPAVVVYLAVGALLLGLLPRATGVLGWLLLLVPTLAGEFAPLLGPGLDWVADISPFRWLPDPLSDSPDLLPALVMVTVSAIGIGVGLAALRRRDVTV